MTMKQKLKYWRNEEGPGDCRWFQLGEEEWHSFITWDSELEDFGEKERQKLLNSRVFGRAVGKKKIHLWKGFKVGKDNRGFKVFRRELFFLWARISKVQRRGGGNRGLADDWCWVPREPGIVPSKKNYFIYLKIILLSVQKCTKSVQ